jgi:hypothetical protein
MQQTVIGSNAPKAMATPRTMGNALRSATAPQRAVRYIAANQSMPSQYNKGQPPTQEEKDVLCTHINDLQHHADTEAGYIAYEEQLRQ